MEIKLNLNLADLRAFSDKYKEKLENAVAEAIEETPATEIVKEQYDQSDLRVRSSVLISSFKERKTKDTIRVWSNVIYARIHDQGGWNGRNHRSYQRPKWYFTRAAKIIKDTLREKIREKLKK